MRGQRFVVSSRVQVVRPAGGRHVPRVLTNRRSSRRRHRNERSRSAGARSALPRNSARLRFSRQTDQGPEDRVRAADIDNYEVVAQELSDLGEKLRGLEDRLAEVERVNARLEEAALTTARAMAEVSRHWDAVYDAMRRADRIDLEISTERDHDAARARRT